ncbi:MAG: hypothetical protein AYK22_05815 [Thermoplasmatales archaeon SG8-52-3]|nr:MAG: hypothetical protein AYK22_05815 [Thermoplasmatales archaeon SG8-52-3]
MIEPHIVKELREEEEKGLLYKKNDNSEKETKSESEKLKDLKFILELQNGVIKDFLSKIKQGKIQTNQYFVLSLNELLNYYNSEYWKIISEKKSINRYILSFIHLVNIYIEYLEQSSNKDDSVNETNNKEIIKLKNIILALSNII